MIYKSREDSSLLAKYVKKYAKGACLDIGTGSGIQALEAAKKKTVKKVIAVDIQEKVIEYCKKNIKTKKIEFLVSDLFSIINKKTKFDMSEIAKQAISEHDQKPTVFDTIIFNPPYLPEGIKLKDLTLDGGKKGYEVLERFFSEANDFLKPNGTILIVFSSLTKKEKIDEFIEKNLLEKKELAKEHIFFETLYAYLIKKSPLLTELEKNKIKDIKYFTKGHRGILFSGNFKHKKVMIKAKLPQSKAIGRIENEAKWLKILNKKNIGPRLLFSKKDYFTCQFIEGDFIIEYLKKSNKEKIKKTIKDIFNQLFILDKLKVNKEEMHRPVKHIIINKKNKPSLLDFERCHIALRPKNVTQFCQFLISGNIPKILKEKGIKINKNKIMKLAADYKKNISKEKLEKIIKKIIS